jgi:transposase-like protein
MRRVQKEYRAKAEATRRARLDSERIEWKCEQCGKAEMRSPHAKRRRFCGHECSQEFNRTSRVMPKFSPAREKTAEIVALYREGIGCKTIAKRLAVSPRIAREILIEQGVYTPGSLHGGENHRRALSESQQALIPAWRREQKKRLEKAIKTRTHAYADLPLFKANDSKKVRARFNERYSSDLAFKLIHCLRSRWRKVAKRGRGYGGNNLAWLGCSPEQFVAHLESQFQTGMSWDNYGCDKGQWSIDHIRPCASFDFKIEAQALACFHFSNAQPMWHLDNIRKGDKWTQMEALSA